MPLVSIPAHFDGSQVRLDEDVALPPNARLIVTVLQDSDAEREDYLRLAAAGLEAAYDEDEVEYTESDLSR